MRSGGRITCGLAMCAESIGGRRSGGERRVWLNFFFLAWLGDPDLTREKSWVRSLNYKAQLEVSVVYLSGYDQQAAAPANLKSRPSVIA